MKTGMTRRSTALRNKRIRSEYQTGRSLRQLAEEYELSRTTVQRICAHLPGGKPLAIRKRNAEMLRLYREGDGLVTHAELAEQYGVRPAAVQIALQREKYQEVLDREAPPAADVSGYSEETIEYARRLARARRPFADIAIRIGATRPVVAAMCADIWR